MTFYALMEGVIHVIKLVIFSVQGNSFHLYKGSLHKKKTEIYWSFTNMGVPPPQRWKKCFSFCHPGM